MKDRSRMLGLNVTSQYETQIQAGKQIPYQFLLHPLLSAEPDLNAIARHEASFLKLAEWSEQFRPVTSIRLGAVRHRVQIRLCTEQRM